MSSRSYIEVQPTSIARVSYDAHKSWCITNANTSSLGGSSGRALDPRNLPFRSKLLPISGGASLSSYQKNSDGTYQVSQWSYFKRFFKDRKNYIPQIPFLYETASYFEIPKCVYGTSIKKGSVCIIDDSQDFTVCLTDNYEGLIVDSNITSSSFCTANKKLVSNYSIDQLSSKPVNLLYSSSICDLGRKLMCDMDVSGSFITQGVPLTGSFTVPTGKGLNFNGSLGHHASIPHSRLFPFCYTSDYAISFWLCSGVNQGSRNNESTIISKKARGESHYPFSLKLGDSLFTNRVRYCVSDGSRTLTLTSCCQLPSGYNHILVQKSGSLIQLYVNGVFDNTGSLGPVGNYTNVSPITIATEKTGSSINRYSGSLYELKFYSQSLTIGEIGGLANRNYLSGSYRQTNVVGFIDYSRGLTVISDSSQKYNNIFMGNGSYNYSGKEFSYSFKGTLPIKNIKTTVKVGSALLNSSFNPSFLQNSNITSSYFRPYITTVGLYDSNYNLLAVAKLSKPIMKSNKFDSIFTLSVNYDNG